METRRAKLALIVLGVGVVTGFAAWAGMRGLAALWILAAALVIGAYALCGYASFGRARWASVVGAAAITLVVAVASFAHLALLAAGVAITAGCVMPASRAPDTPAA